MFPISDPFLIRRGRPYVNIGLIALSSLIFLYELSLGPLDRTIFFYKFGLIAEELTGGEAFQQLRTQGGLHNIESPIPTWGTIFSSMFIHGDIMHFFSNMIFLWVFGDNVEDKLGHVKYLAFYLAAGVIAAWVQVATDFSSQIPLIGASGAIAGVLGAYFLLFPYSQIRTMIFLLFITFIRVPAIWLLGFWILLQFFSGVGSLGPSAQSGGVAYWAHIGGFLAGLVATAGFKLLVWREPLWPRRPPTYSL